MSAEPFRIPSIIQNLLFSGESYTYFSPVPLSLLPHTPKPVPLPASSLPSTIPTTNALLGPPCCLGVDEAGRGPVLGPMVYGLFYLPIDLSTPLLRTTNHFDDSKLLTPAFRASLMRTLCTPSTPLHDNSGWAISLLSARSISAAMLRPTASYNLNAQAMDATISLIQGVYARGINVKEIYIDTIGNPETYQRKLERVFPTAKVTVAKKADSLFACVSAASVCAKVTRDFALEALYENYAAPDTHRLAEKPEKEQDWGSGYPSDVRCTSWLKRNMNPVFGWGNECRFSWGTAKDMLEAKGAGSAAKVDWPVEEDEEMSRVTDYFSIGMSDNKEIEGDELGMWFGVSLGTDAF